MFPVAYFLPDHRAAPPRPPVKPPIGTPFLEPALSAVAGSRNVPCDYIPSSRGVIMLQVV
jgi:hypothetical protein